MLRVYLAGPDVFLPDAHAVARAKQAACAAHGFDGVFPFDIDAEATAAGDEAAGTAIARANIALMRGCDAILANVTPFGGASADVGTAFEMGFFAALDRPIYAYSADPRGFAERVRALAGLPAGATRHADGVAIEDFGHGDNLMLSGAAAVSGGAWIAQAEPGIAALAAFGRCLDAMVARAHAVDA